MKTGHGEGRIEIRREAILLRGARTVSHALPTECEQIASSRAGVIELEENLDNVDFGTAPGAHYEFPERIRRSERNLSGLRARY